MARGTPYLLPNERLKVAQSIWSPDRRFCFGIHRDSLELNLHKFIPRNDKESDLVVVKPLYRGELSSDAYLVMDGEWGKLFLITRTPLGERTVWSSAHPEYPDRYPNAFAVLQPDGNLVVYKEGGSTSRDAIFSTKTVQSTEELAACVAPNYPTLNIINGRVVPTGALVVSNDRMHAVAIRDGQSYLQLPPGNSVVVERRGSESYVTPTNYICPDTLAISVGDFNDLPGLADAGHRIPIPCDANNVVLHNRGIRFN